MVDTSAPFDGRCEWVPARIIDLEADLTTIANGKNATSDSKATPNSLS